MPYSLTHFANGLRCKQHKHGASCAIDTIIELFHFALLGNDGSFSALCQFNPLIEALMKSSAIRTSLGPSCDAREPVWNLLVQYLPAAFSPKGRGDAELLEGILLLVQNTQYKFVSQFNGLYGCQSCNITCNISAVTDPVVFYDDMTNHFYNGQLPPVLMKLLENTVYRQLENTLYCNCGSYLTPMTTDIHMSDFVVLSLSLSQPNCRNRQVPPIVVPEDMGLFGTQYRLCGAVQMGQAGDHFVAIVRRDNCFVVLDDLADSPQSFATFAAAVSRSDDPNRCKVLSPDDCGVCLLIYVKHSLTSNASPDTNLPGGIAQDDTTTAMELTTAENDNNSASSPHSPPSAQVSMTEAVIAQPDANTSSSSHSSPSAQVSMTEAVIAQPDVNISSSSHSSPSAQVSMTEAVIAQPDANTSSSSHSSPNAQVSMTEAVIAQPDVNISASSHSSPSAQVSMTEAVIAQPDANTSSSSHSSPIVQVSMTEAVIAQPDVNISSSSHSSPSAQVSMTEAIIAQPDASTSSPESNSSSICYSPQITDVTTNVLPQVVSHSLVDICGTAIECYSYQDFHYYPCRKVFAVLGIGNYIDKRGYGKVLLTLNAMGGSQSLFITLKGYNRCIRQDALLCFLRNTQVLPRANKKKAVVLHDLMSFVKKRSIKKSLCRNLAEAFPTSPVSSTPQEPSLASRPVPLTPEAASLDHEPRELCPSPVLLPSPSPTLPLSQMPATPEDSSLGCSPVPMTPVAATLPVGAVPLKPGVVWLPSPVSVVAACTPQTEWSPDNAVSSTPKENSVSHGEQSICDLSGSVDLFGKKCAYIIRHNTIFIPLPFVVDELKMSSHKHNRGFKVFDEKITSLGIMDPQAYFIWNGKRRTHISVIALTMIIPKFRNGVIEHKEQVQLALLHALQSIATAKAESVRTPNLQTFVGNTYGDDTDSFVNELSKMIGRPSTDGVSLNKEQIMNLLMSKTTKQKVKIITECIQAGYKEMFPVLPRDTIYLCENFKGQRLLAHLRKLLPGIMPLESQERATRKDLIKSFEACLLPRRTSTGWNIDPSRLLDVLKFRYPYLQGNIEVRLTGDGREYGGRHSTFVAFNVLNNELLANQVSHQSPKECFPVALFYEGDSRDNLEQNLIRSGGGNFINDFLKSEEAKKQYKFYFAADEMFATACLDASGELNPKSVTSWNLYGTNDASQKKEVAESGLRTDLKPLFNRTHSDNIFPEIPLQNFAFCVLHGGARCVEKLLNLEIDSIFSEGRKMTVNKSALDRAELLQNLETNINLRSVKSGNFGIHTNSQSGRPEPVSLNKDSALAIISPAPQGQEGRYPHVLHNVIPVRSGKLPLSSNMLEYLQLPESLEDLELVCKIWESFHFMFTLLKSEPSMQDDRTAVSPHTEGFTWHYTKEQCESYKWHAERFYQLFKIRYSHDHLTPYMMKFIDYAPHFMKTLPLPLNRFQTEGSEHMNYDHNCFYFGHTTRHGGRNKVEPLKALFHHTWRQICYDIAKSDVDVASAFTQFCDEHRAAVTITRFMRGWLVRKKMAREGVVSNSADKAQRLHNYSVISSYLKDQTRVPHSCERSLFAGTSFILAGPVPKFNKKKITQAAVVKMIRDNGGIVKKDVPGPVKGRSTKKYVVLYDRPSSKKDVPKVVKGALYRRYHIVGYNYLFDSVQQCTQLATNDYTTDLSDIRAKMSVQINLTNRHFSRHKTMISLVKEKRAKKVRKKMTKSNLMLKRPMNIAVYYAVHKRKQLLTQKRMPFKDCALGKYMSEWKSLDPKSILHRLTRDRYSKYCSDVKTNQRRKQEMYDLSAFRKTLFTDFPSTRK